MKSIKKKQHLTILVVPISAVGHITACKGALSSLLSRGHRIVFFIEEAFRGKLASAGYEEFTYDRLSEVEDGKKDEHPNSDHMAEWLLDSKIIGDFTAEEKLLSLNGILHSEENYRDNAVVDKWLKVAINQLQPDLFYVDNINLHPAIYFNPLGSAPFILNISLVPNYFVFSRQVPPAESGLPSNCSQEDFDRFTELRREKFYSTKFNDFMQQELKYLDRFPNDSIMPMEKALLTVYAYPDELNFSYIKEQKPHWFNLESFSRPTEDVVPLSDLLPADFLADDFGGHFTSRYILLSMGSLASVDVVLMRRFVDVLGRRAKNHKIIVSKGQRHAEYSLAKNMWGEGFIRQAAFLPHLDLVISHGGNNTVTECFTHGVPMIVAPQFSDQFDNAQRLLETGLGARIHPYRFEEEELVETIDRLLADKELKSRLKAASRRIREQAASDDRNRHQLLADKIEQMMMIK